MVSQFDDCRVQRIKQEHPIHSRKDNFRRILSLTVAKQNYNFKPIQEKKSITENLKHTVFWCQKDQSEQFSCAVYNNSYILK